MAPLLEEESSVVVRQNEDESYTMQLAMSSVLSMLLQSAIELGVFDIIAKARKSIQLSASEIEAQMVGNVNPLAPEMVDRMLRLLASHSVLRCLVVGDESLYSLAPVSKYFVTNVSLIHVKIFLNTWTKLKNSILEGGIPCSRDPRAHAFVYPGSNLRFNHVFNKDMCNRSTIVIKKVLKIYKGFEKLKQVVDIGGCLGVTLSMITAKYPHIKVINFDLPHVIEYAPCYSGVKHVGGDMFESIPNGDAIFMKSIIHYWSDEQCLKLLKSCYKAVPGDGTVIVLESIRLVKPETSSTVKSTSEIDVFMMTQNLTRKERSMKEFLDLATSAGFSGIKFDCFVCNKSLH